jgi:hypothetical protein
LLAQATVLVAGNLGVADPRGQVTDALACLLQGCLGPAPCTEMEVQLVLEARQPGLGGFDARVAAPRLDRGHHDLHFAVACERTLALRSERLPDAASAISHAQGAACAGFQFGQRIRLDEGRGNGVIEREHHP